MFEVAPEAVGDVVVSNDGDFALVELVAKQAEKCTGWGGGSG
jgi:hypothetical protein